MTDPRRHTGAALLLVLATIALVTPACLALAKAASTARLAREVHASGVVADDLFDEAEQPIVDWLAHKSASIVLPPDADEPRTEVLQDSWQVEKLSLRITIIAWDQCGMVPAQLAKDGSPLRLALPREPFAVLDHARIDEHGLGLDLFVGADAEASIYPDATLTGRPPRVALGACVATHNLGRGKVNVHSAPLRLLDAALRETGRSGLDQIVEARSQRKQIPVGSLATTHASELSRGPQIVGSSDCWSFRVDVNVNLVHRSSWSVYQLEGSAWRCVQRLFIGE